MKSIIMGKNGKLDGVKFFGRLFIFAPFVSIFPQGFEDGRISIDTLSIGRMVCPR